MSSQIQFQIQLAKTILFALNYGQVMLKLHIVGQSLAPSEYDFRKPRTTDTCHKDIPVISQLPYSVKM